MSSGEPRAPRAGRTPWQAARRFVTPEGVDLGLRVGEAGDRALALLIDLAVIGAGLVLLSLLALGAAWATLGRGSKAGLEAVGAIWLLGAFVLRNFYFIGLEMRPRAATLGKRVMGLRVIARGGGRLTAEAVFARNALRELELFLPLTFLVRRGAGVDGWLVALGLVWSGVFLLFPLFNRDRLRLGDLAAGTLVVKAPRRLLQPDLAAAPPVWSHGLAFAPAQVEAYGIKELQVLEEVLRRRDRAVIAAVAERIRRKIAWEGRTDIPDQAFLAAYYAALRGRLEGGLLLGRRRRDKFDKA